MFHSEFDNFDQLMNDMSGKGSIHTAHGIMMQEVRGNTHQCPVALPQQKRLKQRSLDIPQENELEEAYVSQRRSPSLVIVQEVIPGSQESYHRAL